ncbi:hypothetical protein BDZ89DRAFT_1056903 [Hymenopellis radicata]|nr:hypothetical protein BDZ89DRAFT_1056903 [Hymenopellis radicata]
MECTSASDAAFHLGTLSPAICTPETEDSWDKISTAISRLTLLCKDGGACDYPETLIPALRSMAEPINSAMKSERTRLSGAAIDFVSELAAGLGKDFEPLLITFLPTLLSLCARTSKIVVNRSRACILVIVDSTQLPAILPHLMQAVKDKSASLRVIACEGALTCLNCFNPPDLEKEARAKDVEALIRLASRDANADVRKLGRKIFEAYKLLLPNRVESFTAPLTPTIKKYLNVTTTKKLPPAQSKKMLSSSTSAVSTQSSVSSSLASSSNAKPHALAKSTSSSLHSTAHAPLSRDPIRPPRNAATNNSHSSKAMPPPATIPIRPILPSKASTSSLKDALNASGPTRPPRPAPPTLAKSTSSMMPVRPPLRAPRPATSTSSDAQRAPLSIAVAFPSGDSDEGADHAVPKSTPAAPILPVRGLPGQTQVQGHTRTRSLFGRDRHDIPQIGKKPEPKPSSSFKPTRQPAPSVAAASRVAATKASSTVKSDATVKPTTTSTKANVTTAAKGPVKAAVLSKSAGFVPKKTGPLKPVTKKPAAVSKPTWGAGPRKAESTKADTKSGPIRSRPASRIATPSEPQVRTSSPEVDIESSPAADEEEVAIEAAAVEAEIEVPVEEPQGITEDDQPQLGQEVTKRLAAASPRPSTPTPVMTERSLWEAKQLEKTPISSLLSSIEQGFLFTPSSPLSPPAGYLHVGRDTTNLSKPFPLDFNRKLGPDREDSESGSPFMFGVNVGESENISLL